MPDSLPKIAFIGLGLMGAPMASHLLLAGHEMHLYSRSRSKAESLIAAGGIWYNTAAAAAAKADIVITMVGLPSDVEALYLSSGGLLDRAKPGAILIDMTTSSPELAIRIAAAAAVKGLSALDAPGLRWRRRCGECEIVDHGGRRWRRFRARLANP